MSLLLLALGLGTLVTGHPRQGISLADCSPLELVIGMWKGTRQSPWSFNNSIKARGSGEPLAPAYGVVVGDPLYEEVKKSITDATGYKVDYPASFASTSRNAGSDDVVKHLKEQSKTCPNQNYVLVGYSQGGDVMHSAAAKLDPSLYSRIYAIVMYGDPG